MPVELVLSFKIYLLAAVISMAVAGVIKVIGIVGAARARTVAAPPAPAVDDEPDEEVIAAIGAAIAATIGRHRIVHVAPRSRGGAWAAEGRTAHHVSHEVPRHASQPTPVKPRR